MTNYNERLDEILAEFVDGCDCRIDEGQAYLHQSEFAADEAKQAITSLIKELVADAKPGKKHVGDEVAENRSYTGERLFNATIDEYHTNLLKALEDK